jgi:hypothetical protein
LPDGGLVIVCFSSLKNSQIKKLRQVKSHEAPFN